MLEYGKVYEIESFLTDDELENVYKEFDEQKWYLGGGEVRLREYNIPIRSFWYKELENTSIEHLFKPKIESILNCKIETNRIYGNGQTPGQCAWPHTDDDSATGEECGTLVYYLHKDWMPHLGGHLVFLEEKRVLKSIFPHSNSAVIFNSRMPHFALDPTVYCLDMRVSIAYKFKVMK